MPPLAMAIPVISHSEQRTYRDRVSPKPLRQTASQRRTYDDGPLPTKPSDSSPKQARIVNRNEDTYNLRIGDVDIRDVAIENVLDYVSQLDLEQFENRQFEEERSVLDVLAADRAQRKRDKLERQKQRAKTKGVATFEEVHSAEETTDGGEVAVGKHGRARPTYTHLFKRPEQTRMQKRHLDTDDGTSLDEHDYEGLSTENEPAQPSMAPPPISGSEITKRRRRKRDKVTGELLPLSPIEQKASKSKQTAEGKRPRRKRHPLTGELMPLGWRYDPENDNDTYEKRRDGVNPHSFRQLSISEEPLVKRQRLDVTSSISRSPSPLPTKAQLAAQHTPAKMSIPSKASVQHSAKVVHNLISSDDESVVNTQSMTPRNLKSPPKPLTATPRQMVQAPVLSTDSSSEQDSSPEPTEKISMLELSASKGQSSQRNDTGKTSIMNPSFRAASSVEPSDNPDDSDRASEEDDLDEGEWFIEDILGHQWSDPDTHPTAFGTEPVMLYLVKWEGYDNPTYEPVESFGDRSIVTAYRKKVGLDLGSNEDEVRETTEKQTIGAQSSPRKEVGREESEGDEDEDDDGGEEDQFEVENILDHRHSDPRTHPAGLGNRPVILYQVKWRGYEEPTWEPASGFENKGVLQLYHTRISRGLRGLV